MFDVHCGDRDEDLELCCAADALPVVSLDAKTAATLTATEVEQLLRVGPSNYATVCEILDLAARLADTHGARDAIERIERVNAHARLAT
ncbi:hypothetical protein DBR17_07060 [Sphingomonas sp. HMWF008]|nr:hypothetical protein DBR17_07060 [Sphingomonas sp. HMWF008]